MNPPQVYTSILQCSAFFTVQLSHPYMTSGKTIALIRWTFVGKVKPESKRKENKEFKNTCTRFRKINDRNFWMHDTGCLGLVHWDDPEGWDEEGGGRRGSGWGTHVHPWLIHGNVWQNHHNIIKQLASN